MNPSETILGIDPGTSVAGYGIIIAGSRLEVVDYGCIRMASRLKLSERCLILADGIEELLERYPISTVVLELQYVHKNPQSAITLGIARGIVMLVAKRKKLPLFAYNPSKAKKAVTGQGKASKWQVQKMVQHRLGLPEPPQPEDAADALALALCHAQASRLTSKEL